MKVRTTRDLDFNCEGSQITLACGTVLWTVPIRADAILSAAGPRDDLREIAGFTGLVKELKQRPFAKGRTRMTSADVLVVWSGLIRFLTIGDGIEIIG